jgi:S-formylglutathione hydrolase FrmB
MSQSLKISQGRLAAEGLTFLTVKSPALRGRGDISLFIPEEAANLSDVPAVLLLHGAHGSHWNWPVLGNAHKTAQALIREGRIPPMMLIMPSDGLWGDGSGYLPHAEQDFEKWIVEDVPAGVRAAAVGLTAASPLFLCGLSMGGFGALRLGAKHPGFCRGISAHSSITHFEQILKYVEEEAGRYQTRAEDHCVFDTLMRHRESLPPIRFDCGARDPLAKYNRQLSRDLTAQGVAHQYEEFPGAHEWAYWTEHLADSLLFFGNILTGKNHA